MRLTLRDLVIEAVVLVAVALVVAFLGPFGTWELGGLSDRLLYWGTLIIAGYVVIRPTVAFAPAWAERLRLPELAVWLGAVLAGSLPFSLVVWFANGSRRSPRATELLTLYPNVALIGVMVAMVFWTLRRRPAAAEAAAAATAITERAAARAVPEAAPARPRLLARLPAHLPGPVVAVEMEDHYARVHTPVGSALLLMRMRDAVAELDGADGAQVHRSWWVARMAVEAVEPDGRNVRLRLSGGMTAPVARGQVAVLREAGWPV